MASTCTVTTINSDKRIRPDINLDQLNANDEERPQASGNKKPKSYIKPHKCTQCKVNLRTSEQLEMHVKVKHNNELLLCDVCDKTFTTVVSFRAHRKIHQEDKPYICKVCSGSFKNKYSLKEHYKIHNGAVFTCQFCAKDFNTLNNLKQHETRHTGGTENKFKCKICNKYIGNSHKKPHMRIHTGERPFKCTMCDSAFGDKSNLQKHYRIHTGEKPYKCNVCDKAFSQNSALTCHKRSHESYKPCECKYCGKKFGIQEELLVHLRLHGEQKMFKCSYCDLEFQEHSYLKSHIRLHSQLAYKPKSVNVCSEILDIDDERNYLKEGEEYVPTKKSKGKPQKRKTNYDSSSDSSSDETLQTICNRNKSQGNIKQSGNNNCPTKHESKTKSDNLADSKDALKSNVEDEKSNFISNDGDTIVNDIENVAKIDPEINNLMENKADITIKKESEPINSLNNDGMNDKKRFQCSQCPTTYSRQYFLRKHYNEKHSGNETVCDQKFKCSLCPMAFTRNNNLQYHVRKLHTRNFECTKCKLDCVDAVSFKKHKSSCSKASKINDEKDDDFFSNELGRCDYEWDDDDDGTKVEEIEKNIEIDNKKANSANDVNIESKSNDIELGTNEPILENTHNDITNNFDSLLEVLKESILPPFYKCPDCPVTYKRKNNLDNHIVKVHSRNYVCTKCTFNCIDYEGYRMHKKRCKNLHLPTSALAKHMKKHTDIPLDDSSKTDIVAFDKVFIKVDEDFDENVCDVYNKDNDFYDALNDENTQIIKEEEILIDDNEYAEDRKLPIVISINDIEKYIETVQKPILPSEFQCPQCPLSYGRKPNLDYHIVKVHTHDFVCKICELDCIDYLSYKQHKANCYESQKPAYKCKLCDRVLAKRSAVRAHINRMHISSNTEASVGIAFDEELIKSDTEIQSHDKSDGQLNDDVDATVDEKFKMENLKKGLDRKAISSKVNYIYVNENYDIEQFMEILKDPILKPQKFQCPKCPFKLTYTREADLQYHIMNVHTHNYECTKCKFDCIDFNGYKKHKRYCRNSKPVLLYRCKICDKLLGNRIKFHIRKHTGNRPYKCSMCNSSFADKYHFQIHFSANHTGKSLEIETFEKNTDEIDSIREEDKKMENDLEKSTVLFQCSQCPSSYTHKHNLLRHCKDKHSEQKTPIYENRFKCGYCSATYTKNRALERHNQMVHIQNFICSVCNLDCVNFSRFKKHRKHCNEGREIAKRQQCLFCNKTYRFQADLDNHENGHTNKRPYTCDYCLKSYRSKHCMRSHLLNLHSGLSPHKCDICDKSFVSKGHLSQHKLKHSDLKPFPCNVCNKSLKSKGRLYNHMKSHQEDSYKCSHCGKGCKSLAALQDHETRHLENVDKKFACKVCGKSFVQKMQLANHMHTHTGERPYGCTLCSSRFADKSNLSAHMRIHTGLKPYKCSVCNKEFSQLSSLNSHKKIHITFKPFKCEYCTKDFATNENLISHLRVHGDIRMFKCSVCGKEYEQLCHFKSHCRLHYGNEVKDNDRNISLEDWSKFKLNATETKVNANLVDTANYTQTIDLLKNVNPHAYIESNCN